MEIALYYQHPSGSVADNLRQVQRQSGKDWIELVKDMDMPRPTHKVPDEYYYVLDLYNLLRRTKSEGFNGPNALTFSEIESFCKLTRRELTDWELWTVLELDAGIALQLRLEREKDST